VIGAAELLAFLGVATLVIVTPGQDTALTIRNTVLGGRRAGVLTAVGVSGGQAVWTLATSAGLAALIVASEPVFDALKLAGAAYLVWLGLQALRTAIRGSAKARHEPAGDTRLAQGRAFRQGLVSNLGNPKMALFFTSLLPQFAPASGPAFAWLLALGLLFCAMTLAWLTGYAVAVARAGDVLRRPKARRAIDAVTGTLLVALGLRLAAEQR
jgi:threonine/homoserine/homoserine lactone efflux protein